eukprot:m.211945 g.211945  ORF g.211945 m.211945 type:complete len:728 (+) comp16943_c0_seq3:296-2479(+)
MSTTTTRMTRQALREGERKRGGRIKDISCPSKNLTTIEKLDRYTDLERLILRSNLITRIPAIGCPNLWYIDLSNNQLNDVDGLAAFICLGYLVLPGNRLSIESISKLRDVQIMWAMFYGNPIESDPLYRERVAVALPHLWSLDGRLISWQERQRALKKVQPPTIGLARRQQPLRSAKAIEMIRSLPVSGFHTRDIDWRRLLFMALDLQDMMTNDDVGISHPANAVVHHVLQGATSSQLNLLALLLVGTFDYALPEDLVVAMLRTADVYTISNHDTRIMFYAPARVRCLINSIFAAACNVLERKTDQDQPLCGVTFSSELHRCVDQTAYLQLRHAFSPSCALPLKDIESPRPKSSLRVSHQTRVVDYGNLLPLALANIVCRTPETISHLSESQGRVSDVEKLLSDATCVTRPDALDVARSLLTQHQQSGAKFNDAHPALLFLRDCLHEEGQPASCPQAGESLQETLCSGVPVTSSFVSLKIGDTIRVKDKMATVITVLSDSNDVCVRYHSSEQDDIVRSTDVRPLHVRSATPSFTTVSAPTNEAVPPSGLHLPPGKLSNVVFTFEDADANFPTPQSRQANFTDPLQPMKVDGASYSRAISAHDGESSIPRPPSGRQKASPRSRSNSATGLRSARSRSFSPANATDTSVEFRRSSASLSSEFTASCSEEEYTTTPSVTKSNAGAIRIVVPCLTIDPSGYSTSLWEVYSPCFCEITTSFQRTVKASSGCI